MNRSEFFKEEIAFIKNPKTQELARKLVEQLPDYFFEIPASSTGKYHPAYSLGEGGLYRHTRALIRIMVELFRVDMFKFTEDERDHLIISGMLHDGWKSGETQNQYTLTEHPLIAARKIRENEDLFVEFSSVEGMEWVAKNISSHMGQWTRDYKTNEEVLPLPVTKAERFLHLCDYLASRKCLIMDFDIPVKRE